jgi:hypothetical protein
VEFAKMTNIIWLYDIEENKDSKYHRDILKKIVQDLYDEELNLHYPILIYNEEARSVISNILKDIVLDLEEADEHFKICAIPKDSLHKLSDSLQKDFSIWSSVYSQILSEEKPWLALAVKK